MHIFLVFFVVLGFSFAQNSIETAYNSEQPTKHHAQQPKWKTLASLRNIQAELVSVDVGDLVILSMPTRERQQTGYNFDRFELNDDCIGERICTK